MPRVDINGNVVDFPDTLSPDDLNRAVASAAQQLGGAQKPKESLPLQAWHGLQKPSEMSRSGLQMLTTGDADQREGANQFLASMGPAVGIPAPTALSAIQAFRNLPTETGNLPYDLVRGAPKIAIETAAQTAPAFINRASMVGSLAAKAAGALAPLAKGALRAIGNQGEQLSGIAPKAAGTLEAVYKDPSLLFAEGKSAAGASYESAKDDFNAAKDSYRQVGVDPNGVGRMAPVQDIFTDMYKPEEILDKANSFVAQGGKLEPAEALKARKAVDSLLRSKSYVPDELYKMRDIYDQIAKGSQGISEGDAAYVRGLQADAVKNWFPQNKYGGASPFKMMMATGMRALGVPDQVSAMAFSPRLQGLIAGGTGVAARQAIAPIVNSAANAAGLSAIIEALQRRRQNAAVQ